MKPAYELRPDVLASMGLGCIRVRRAGAVVGGWTFPAPRPRLCSCTDLGRNQPLENCPRCGGRGEC